MEKRVFFGIVFVLGILFSILFFINFERHSDLKKVNPNTDFFMNSDSGSVKKPFAVEHTDEDVAAFRKLAKEYDNNLPPDIPLRIVEDYYDLIGPEVMLAVLDENPYCHEQGHNVGKVVFKRNKNFSKSLDICGLSCGQGCFHGVLMQIVSQYDSEEYDHVEDILTSDSAFKNFGGSFEDFVQGLCPAVESSRGINHVQCHHGLGHALMTLSGNNVSKAIDFCTLLTKEGDQFYCATGVYMEFFLVFGTDHPGLYPCNVYADFPAACYRYKFGYGEKSLDLIDSQKKQCDSLKGIHRLGCFYGLGHGYERYLVRSDISLTELCDGDLEVQKMCVDGVIVSLAFYNYEAAVLLCETLTGALRDHCFEATKFNKNSLDRSFENYYYIE